MKTTSFLFCSFILFSVVALNSCKKKSNEPSVQSKLAGTWKTVSAGYDKNNNSVIEADETFAYPDSVSFTVIFDQGGTGVSLETINNKSDTLSFFTWTLGNNNTEMTTTRTKGYSSFVSLSNSNTYKIVSVTSADLQLSILSSGQLNWNNYKKQ